MQMANDYPEIPDFIKKLIESGEQIDEIRIDEEGNWSHNGVPFSNKRIIDFFNRSIDVTEEGECVIYYSDFVYPVVVEDVPIFITGITIEGFGDSERILLNLSTGEVEELDIDSLFYRDNHCLYSYVRNGRIPAKFKRSPSYQILERLEESEDTFYLRIGGKRIVLKEKIRD
jgi:hypothetical protein